MAAQRFTAAALLVCIVALLAAAGVQAAAVVGEHEHACGAAFGVLRHCAATGTKEDVRRRCCGLLEAFKRNGCLCPDCPEGASAGATSAKGLMLAEELAGLMDHCADSAAATTAGAGEGRARLVHAGAAKGAAAQHLSSQREHTLFGGSSASAEQEQQLDETDLMADMAGVAAAVHGPKGTLMNTPAEDYDNMLSDADTAFQLVDPQVAQTYASKAADLAVDLAAELAADLAAGMAEGRPAADLATDLEARIEELIGALNSSKRGTARAFSAAAVPHNHHTQQQQQQQRSQEDAASAAALTDDSAEAAPQLGSAANVRLAAPGAVKQTAEYRRAAALAAAVERQQVQHLKQQLSFLQSQGEQGEQTAVPDAIPITTTDDAASASASKHVTLDIDIDAQNPEAARTMIGGAAALAAAVGRQHPPKKVTLDIDIDAENPEAAQEMLNSAAALAAAAQSGSAAGGAPKKLSFDITIDAENPEAATRMVSTLAAALGRAGLQPQQLLLQQYEETRQQGQQRQCSCMDLELLPSDGPATLSSTLYAAYISARLSLCRFACQHQQALVVLLAAELLLCATWLAVWLLRGRGSSGGQGSESDDEDEDGSSPMISAGGPKQQFMVVAAGDPEWTAEAKQPLLASGHTV